MLPSNCIKFHRSPSFQGIESCEAIRIRHAFPNHSHEDIYAFSLMRHGGSYVNGKSREDTLVKPGNIAVINPGQVHSGVPATDGAITYLMIYIDKYLVKEIVDDILEDDGGMPEFQKTVLAVPGIAGLFLELYSSLTEESERIKIDSAMTAFLGKLTGESNPAVKKLPETGTESMGIRKAADFLAGNLYQKMTLELAAGEAGMSRYHFLRTFKKHTGVSPHVYRTQKRIEAAKKLIIAGMPFSQIAMETGFTDQSHFTTQFKNYTGATPNQYLSE